jgi:hypothetical protein
MSPEDPRTLRSLTSQVIAAGPALWSAGVERRATAIAQAMATLRDAETPLGGRARAELPASTGLSLPMIAWALEHALGVFDREALIALDAACAPPHAQCLRAHPGQLAVVVLAGNVFTAAAKAVALPLLFGWPVVAKAASRDDAFARLFESAFAGADPELSEAYRCVTVPSSDVERMGLLFEQADAVSVYGSDGTLNRIRAELSATATFLPHGHGLSVAIVGPKALCNEDDARAAARALARDTAAYDQRGCLSPHVAWVVRGAEITPSRFADLVFDELARLAQELPRGPLPLDVGSAQWSWRGLSAIHGTLLEGDGFAVALESHGNLRLSPGYRNLQLLELDCEAELCAKLSPLGIHLKCVGHAGVDAKALARALPQNLAPRLCALGSMQTPKLTSITDGLAPWDGLVRWVDLE